MSYIHKCVWENRMDFPISVRKVPMAMRKNEERRNSELKYFQRLTLMTVFTFNFAFPNSPTEKAGLRRLPHLSSPAMFTMRRSYWQSFEMKTETRSIPSLIIIIIRILSLASHTRNLRKEKFRMEIFC